jgi:hypothetical protein
MYHDFIIGEFMELVRPRATNDDDAFSVLRSGNRITRRPTLMFLIEVTLCTRHLLAESMHFQFYLT